MRLWFPSCLAMKRLFLPSVYVCAFGEGAKPEFAPAVLASPSPAAIWEMEERSTSLGSSCKPFSHVNRNEKMVKTANLPLYLLPEPHSGPSETAAQTKPPPWALARGQEASKEITPGPTYLGELEDGWGGRGRQQHLQLAGALGSRIPRTECWWVRCVSGPPASSCPQGPVWLGRGGTQPPAPGRTGTHP